MKVNGSGKIRAGTQDPKEWQFLEADGTTPVDLTNATKVTMRLKNETTAVSQDLDTEGLLEIVTPATDGKVKLSPAADTFPAKATYRFYFIITDSIGNHPIPEDHDETLEIIDNYPPSS